jgi:hypothetical protein
MDGLSPYQWNPRTERWASGCVLAVVWLVAAALWSLWGPIPP